MTILYTEYKLEIFLDKCKDKDTQYICPGFHWVILAFDISDNIETQTDWCNSGYCGIETSPMLAFISGMEKFNTFLNKEENI